MVIFELKEDYTPIYFTEHLTRDIDVMFDTDGRNVSIYVTSPQMYIVPSNDFLCGTDVCGRIIYL